VKPGDPESADQDLAWALAAVGDLVQKIRPDQWTAPTPCSDWDVRGVVEHLVGMNLVFAAMLTERPLPRRETDRLGNDPVRAFDGSAAELLVAFRQPGIGDRVFEGPRGRATGSERLQIRLYDLLAHGWDLGRAIGAPFEVPDDLALRSLAFARIQVPDQDRHGRFDPAKPVAADAPGIDRLAAFLGRSVDWRADR
jgi:uncharacterized protein (TIGR03086 family)